MAKEDQGLTDAVYETLMNNITKLAKPSSGTCIPQRHYCQGATMPGGTTGQIIMFAMIDGNSFPARLAIAGQFDLLVDAGGSVFAEKNHTINLRIEWPGYDGWGAQIRTVDYREDPKSITRAKLMKEIAKQLEKFLENVRSTEIDPNYAIYKVGGTEGIELRHIHIASLEQVSRGSWQPRFIYTDT